MTIALDHRPKKFGDVLGQHATVKILINSILLDRVPNAILLTGTRGNGKTTLARLYGKALNCQNFERDLCGVCKSCVEKQHLDIFEFDAASSNGVDFIRDLDYTIKQRPVYNKKIFIFDECHMWTTQAQAAFLKKLEEPPKNVVFILVTTNPEKLEKTIKSRCMFLPLRGINAEVIKQSILDVLKKERLQATDDFINTLTRQNFSSIRDMQQVLQRAIFMADGVLDVDSLSGFITSYKVFLDIAAILNSANLKFYIDTINKWYNDGQDLREIFFEALPLVFNDFLLYLSSVDVSEYRSGIPKTIFDKNIAINVSYVKFLIQEWETTYDLMKVTNNEKAMFISYAAKVCP